jgi:hypothetical protein
MIDSSFSTEQGGGSAAPFSNNNGLGSIFPSSPYKASDRSNDAQPDGERKRKWFGWSRDASKVREKWHKSDGDWDCVDRNEVQRLPKLSSGNGVVSTYM